jgi:cyclopropane fatty-acyl-phospholipid synthase-like methyltransferase
MPNSVERFDGDFYDADYYERGKDSGKGWLENYKWMPRRTFKEAFAYIDSLGLNESSYVLDVGCAKGFIVRALNELEIKSDGCDISEYALSFTGDNCWNCSNPKSWDDHINFGYTHAIAKDVFEHLTKEQLPEVLSNIGKVTKNIMCIIPMGDNGIYRIPEYHMEISHLIIENEGWWINQFYSNGWILKSFSHHINGLKDNWKDCAGGNGNCVFILEKKC